jgi:dimethylamine/trimethylamine dehydrogenase
VEIIPLHQLLDMNGASLTLECVYSGKPKTIECSALIPVTSRLPNDQLSTDLLDQQDQWQDAGIITVNAIGDCLAPGLIAAATYSGHEIGRALDAPHVETLREDFSS